MGIASEAVTDKLYMPINKVCVAVRRGATQIQRGVRLGCIALLSLSVNLHAAPGIDALPSGGNISAGNGTISSQGNQMLIHQVSDKLAINWSSYNIGANASVTYQQPNSQAIALNRILSADPSQIYGRLNANGQVIFVNPNGVVFGPGSRVDVGAMIVSTLDLSDSDFMSSNYRFTTPSANSLNTLAPPLLNQGNIVTSAGGYLHLIGHNIQNQGTISAPGGTVGFLAGDTVSLSLSSHGTLLPSDVSMSIHNNASISNSGVINAPQGVIQLRAYNAGTSAEQSNQSEEITNRVVIDQSGTLDSARGRILVDGGNTGIVQQNGRLSTVHHQGVGGDISVLGDKVGLFENSRVDASGSVGGGKVLIGGNWQGQGPEQNASAVYMDALATIKADALLTGNGGQVVLWSNDYTGFYGSISARGGVYGGNGGQVETSSHDNLQAMGSVNTSATNGQAGSWLLDPASVTITSNTSNITCTPSACGTSAASSFVPNSGAGTATINVADIVAALNAGTSVTVTTTNTGTAGTGTAGLTVQSSILKTAGGNASLTLNSDGNLTINPGVSIRSTQGLLDINLNAGLTTNGTLLLNGNAPNSVQLESNGGVINLRAGTASVNGQITLLGSTLNSAGGAILLQNFNGSGNQRSISIGTNDLANSYFISSISSGSGALTINGVGGGTAAVIITGGALLSSTSGEVNITGTATGVWGVELGFGSIISTAATATQNAGGINIVGITSNASGAGGINVNHTNVDNKIYSLANGANAAGPITLQGLITATSGTVRAITAGGTGLLYVGWDGGSNVTNGNITIQGQDAGNNGGMNLAPLRLKTNGGAVTIGATGRGLGSFTLPATLLASGTIMNSLSVGGVSQYGTITSNMPISAASNVTLNGPANFEAGATYNNAAKNNYGGGIFTISSPITTNNAPINLLVGNAVSGAAASAQGSIYINTTTLTASGANGNITLANGSAGSTASAFNTDSINISNSTLTAGNGISLIGLASTRVGVESPSATLIAGTGGITMIGSGATFGVALGGVTMNTSGRVSITGTATSSGGGGNEAGISMWKGTNSITSSLATGPAITLIGIARGSNRPAIMSGSGTTGNGQLNLVGSNAGDITIQGQDNGTGTGMNLSGIRVQTSGGALTVGAMPFSAGVAGTSASSGLGLGSFTVRNGFIVNGTVLSNLAIGGVNNYGTITMSQVLGCATPTACGATGVSLGNGTTIPTFPITIQVGGMYASGTNTIASPAALSANSNGGNLAIGGAITTANQAITLLAGQAVPTSGSNYATAAGGITVSQNLTAAGGNILVSNMNPNTNVGSTISGFNSNTGVSFSNGTVSTIGAGTITINGAGANYGVSFASESFTTVNGNINIVGRTTASAHAVGSTSGINRILATGTGNINITGTAIGASTLDGILLSNTTVGGNGTGTGNITMLGTTTGSGGHGVELQNSTTVATTGNGAIQITGVGQGTSSWGVPISATTISTVNGAININGTTSGSSPGMGFYGGTNYVYSNTGAVNLVGINTGSGAAVGLTAGTAYIGWNNGSIVTTGNLSILGQDAGTNAGMALGGFILKTNGGTLTVGPTGNGVGKFTLNNGFLANGTVLSNLTLGGLNQYGTLMMIRRLGCAGQAITACSTGVTLGTGSGGTGSNFVAIPVTIQAGGMYTYTSSPPIGCTINVNCAAGGTNSPYGGAVHVGQNGVVAAPITTAGTDIQLLAGSAVSGSTATGGVYDDGSALVSNGGNIILANTPLNNSLLSSSSGLGSGANNFNGNIGVYVRGVGAGTNTLDASAASGNGGHIIISGRGVIQANNGSVNAVGVSLNADTSNTLIIRTNGTGNITITGDGGTLGNGVSAGVYFVNPNISLITGSGGINVTGTVRKNGPSGTAGIWFNGANPTSIYSTATSGPVGDISLNGYSLGAATGSAIYENSATVNIGWNGGAIVSIANISILGADSGTNAGMYFPDFRIKTNGGTLTIGAIPFSAGVAGTSASSGLGLGGFTVPTTLIAHGSVLSNLSIGGVNNYGTITMNQVIGNGTLNSGVCGGTGTVNCLTGSATIQAGGMYASGTNTIASPATLSAKADGNITIAANITKTAGGDANLMLSAGKTVQFNSGINLTSTVGKFNTIIEAATTITDGNVRFWGSNTVNTNGGDITVSAGSNLLRGAVWFHSGSLISSGGNITLQNGSAGSIASFNRSTGVDLEGGAITVDARASSGGGTITLLGTGALSGTITHSIGLDVENAIIQTNGSGALNITGISGTVASGSNVAAALYLDGGVTFATESGPINLSGKLQSSGGTGNSAIYASSGTTKIYSTGNAGQADISIRGEVTTGSGQALKFESGAPTYIGWDNASNVTSGNITIQGQDTGTNAGMTLTGVRIRTNGGTLTVGATPFSAGVVGTSASSGLGLGGFTLSNGFIANGTVLSNLSIGGVNNYGTITMNQVLGCTTPTACGATGVSLGNGTTIPTFPVTIQAGGMYASGTNTIASPAVLSAITNGGNLSIGGSITTNNQAINILAGGAVPIISGGNVYSVSTGSVFINISTLRSGGGNINIGNIPVSGSSTAAANANFNAYQGVLIDSGSQVNAGGGHIVITGIGTNTNVTARGVQIDGAPIQTSGAGTLTIIGDSGNMGTTVGTFNDAGVLLGGSVVLSTESGLLSVMGTQRSKTYDPNYGVRFYGATSIYSSSGDIQITGINTNNSNSAFAILAQAATTIGWNGGVSTPTTGNINLRGQDSGNGAGIDLTNISVKTNGGILTVGSTGKGVGAFTVHSSLIATGTVLSGLNLGDANTYGTITLNQAIGNGTYSSGSCSGTNVNCVIGPVSIQAGGLYDGSNSATVGNIAINQNITTTDSSANAIVIGTGNNSTTLAAQGTADNVTLAATRTLTTGTGGRIVIYSGSVAGTTGFSTLIPAGSNRFGYGRVYSDTSLLPTPAAGNIWLQYREQPTLTLTALTLTEATKVYDGAALTGFNTADTLKKYYITTNTANLKNGDTNNLSTNLSNANLTFTNVGMGATAALQDTITHAAAYTVGLSSTTGLIDSRGYAISYGSPTLPSYTITPAPLTVSLNAGVTFNKIYDGTVCTGFGGGGACTTANNNVSWVTSGNNQALSTSVFSLSGFKGSDTATFNIGNAVYDGSHVAAGVGQGTSITLSNLSLSSLQSSMGSFASDYSISAAPVSASISPAPLSVTLTPGGAFNKVYDGTVCTGFGGGSGCSTANSSVAWSSAGSDRALNGNAFTLSGFKGTDSGNLSIGNAVYNGSHVAAGPGQGSSITLSSLSVSGLQTSMGSQASDYSVTLPSPIAANVVPRTLSLTANLTPAGQVSKTYNGSNTATLTTAHYSVSGFISNGANSDSAPITFSNAVYDSIHVANASQVTATAVLGNLTTFANASDPSLASDYQFISSFSTSNVAINPKLLTLTPVLDTSGLISKVYDGTNTATVTAANYSVSGFVGNDSASITLSNPVYNSIHVLDANQVTAQILGLGSFTTVANASDPSVASDYQLPTTFITNNAAITPRPLSVSAVLGPSGLVSKVYDGTTGATLTSAHYSVSGFINNESAPVNLGSAAYNSMHVVGANQVSASILSLGSFSSVANPGNPSVASDYQLPSLPFVTNNVSITPRPLAVSAGAALSKLYDGLTSVGPTTQTSGGVTLGTNYIYTVGAVAGNAQSGFVNGDSGASINHTSAVYQDSSNNPASHVNPGTQSVGQATHIAVNGLYVSALTNNSNPATPSNASDYILVNNSGVPIDPSSATALNLPASITPVTVSLGYTNRLYDGDTSLNAGGIVVADTINGETLTTTAGQAASPNVGTSYVVTSASDPSCAPSCNVLQLVSGTGWATDYQLPLSQAYAKNLVRINADNNTPLQLIISKIYDGTTAITSPEILIITPDGKTLTFNSATANSSHVTSNNNNFLASLMLSDGTGMNAGILSNYVLNPLSAYTFDIMARPVVVGTTGTLSKVYDGTTATIGTTAAITNNIYRFSALNGNSVSGLLNGDSLTLSNTDAAYNTSHAGQSNTKISINGLAINAVSSNNFASVVSDYKLVDASNVATSTTQINGAITPAPLTITSATNLSKVYDGGTQLSTNNTSTIASTNSYNIIGFVNGDNNVNLTVGVNAAGSSYNTAHVASANSVTINGLSIANISGGANGSLVSDYQFVNSQGAPTSSVTFVGQITPAPLTITSGTTFNKIYDGGVQLSVANANAINNAASYSLNGFVGGDTNMIVGLSANSSSSYYNSAHVATANSVTVNGVTLTSLSGGLNNSAASDYQLVNTLSAPTSSVNFMASINPAPLNIVGTGTLTKVYDGTTATIGTTAAVAQANYSISGFISGDTGALINNTGALYNSTHVVNASGVTVNGLSLASITGSNNSLASDYVLGSVANPTSSVTINANITPAALSVVGTGSLSKVYDGTTATIGTTAAVAQTNYSISGLVAGDTGALLNHSSALYNDAHVVTASSVTATGLTIASISGSNSSLASDYVLGSVANPTSSVTINANITPAALSVVGTGSLSKVYDGTTATSGTTAEIAQTNYSISGFINGDTGALINNTSALYNSIHVATATSVTATGLTIASISGSNSSLASDYVLGSVANPTSSVTINANITPVALSVVGTGSLSKVYDGTTATSGTTAEIAQTNYSISGFINGDTGALINNTSALYNSIHVANATSVTATGLTIASISGSNSSLASDYVLGSVASPTNSVIINANITPAELSVVGTGTLSKVYDGTTATTFTTAAVAQTNYLITGFISGDSGATLHNSSALYNNAHVANATSVTASGLTITGISGSNSSMASDYILGSVANPISSVTINATITPAALSVVGTGTLSKVYDGTTATIGTTAAVAQNNYAITGFISGDIGALINNTNALYNDAHVANASSVTASGLTIAGISGSNNSAISDYVLGSVANPTDSILIDATITPRPVTVETTISGQTSKIYDGSVSAPNGTTVTVLGATGALSGDTFILDTSNILLSYNSAHVTLANALNVTGTQINSVTISTFNSVLSDYVVAIPNASVAATITPAVLSVVGTGTLTKVYDGTTATNGTTAEVAQANYSLSGFISGDTGATLNNSSALYNTAHVSTADRILVSGLNITDISGNNGSWATDYVLGSVENPTTSLTISANISPVVLSVIGTGTLSKVYDGNTATTGTTAEIAQNNYSISGFINGDTVAILNHTNAVYNNPHVLSASNVNVSGLSIASITGNNSSLASDYVLGSVANPITSVLIDANISPAVLSLTANGTLTKVYDGGTATIGTTAALSQSNYSISGFISGDTVATLNNSSAVYNSAHVATATDVIVSGLNIVDITGANGSLASDYVLGNAANPTTSLIIDAHITPAELSVVGTGTLTKVYDGTAATIGTTAAVAQNNYLITGFIHGDTGALLNNSSALYNNAHVANATSVTATGLNIEGISGSNGSAITDYILGSLANPITSVTINANITPASLSVVGTGTLTKVYDGTTSTIGTTAQVAQNNYIISGFVTGDTGASLNYSNALYNNAHVVNATSITATGLTITGVTGINSSMASDYVLGSVANPTSSVTINANITPAALSVVGTGSLSKVYDGTTATTGTMAAMAQTNYLITGFISGDTGAILNNSGALYNNAHVANATSVTATGLTIASVSGNNSSLASDYILGSVANPTSSVTINANITPVALSVVGAGILSKVYDGTMATTGTTAEITQDNYLISGLINGDSAAIVEHTSALYNNAHVANANSVTANGLSLVSISGVNSSLASDYVLGSLANPTTSVTINASIKPAALSIIGAGTLTKVYDGTTATMGTTAAVDQNNYSLSGFISGDTGAILSNTGALYNNAHVANAMSITASGLTIIDISGNNSSLASDYILGSVANPVSSVTINATITPAVLNIVGTGTLSKVYDGTTATTGTTAAVAQNNYSLSGFISGDSGALLNNTGALYNNAHVANASGVTVTGLTITGVSGNNNSETSDYVLGSVSNPTTSVIINANITPAALSIVGTGNLSKVYDGTTATIGTTAAVAQTNYSITGFINGDSGAVVNHTSVLYNNAHVVNASSVTATGLTIASISGSNSSMASDYVLGSVANPTSSVMINANITPAALSVVGTGTLSKVYDGTTTTTGTTAAVAQNNYLISGFINGDSGAVVNHASALYNNAHVVNASSVTATGLTIASISGSNSSMVSDYVLGSVANPTSSVTINANITPAALSVVGAGTLSKVYDGTTATTGTTAAVAQSNYLITGFINGDTGAMLNNSGALYNNAHVANASSVTASGLSLASITGSNGSMASDYILGSVANPTNSVIINANITPAGLSVVGTGTLSKVYDGTTATTGTTAAVAQTNYLITGFINGDSGAIVNHTSALYNNAHVANASSVTASGLSLASISGSNSSLASDYMLGSVLNPTTSVTINANITPAALSVVGIGSLSKVYDNTTATIGTTAQISQSNYSVTGLVGGDTAVSLAYTNAVYNTPDVVSAAYVTVGGLSVAGISGSYNSAVSDYVLGSVANPTATVAINANITPAPLTINGLTLRDKTYDGTTQAEVLSVGSIIGRQGADALAGAAAVTLKNQLFDGFISKNTNVNASGQLISNQNIMNLSLNSVMGLTGSAASNYYIQTVVAGNSPRISPALLTIRAVPVTIDFGGVVDALPQVIGLIGTDTVSNLAQGFGNITKLGRNCCQVNVTSYTVSDDNNGQNYAVQLESAIGSVNAKLPGVATDYSLHVTANQGQWRKLVCSELAQGCSGLLTARDNMNQYKFKTTTLQMIVPKP